MNTTSVSFLQTAVIILLAKNSGLKSRFAILYYSTFSSLMYSRYKAQPPRLLHCSNSHSLSIQTSFWPSHPSCSRFSVPTHKNEPLAHLHYSWRRVSRIACNCIHARSHKILQTRITISRKQGRMSRRKQVQSIQHSQRCRIHGSLHSRSHRSDVEVHSARKRLLQDDHTFLGEREQVL